MTPEEVLAEVQARADAARRGPWTTEQWLEEDRPYPEATNIAADRHGDYFQVAVGLWCDDAAFIAAARDDVPRLVAALNAVLALHRPITCASVGTGEQWQECEWCEDPDYPCATVRAVTAHLIGETT